MANAIWRQQAGNFEEQVVEIFCSWVILGSGAVGTVKGGGVSGVVKDATAGQYTIQMDQTYNRILFLHAGAFGPSPLNVQGSAQLLANPATFQSDVASTGQLTVQFLDFTGAPANPTPGSVATARITLRNSTVGPWD